MLGLLHIYLNSWHLIYVCVLSCQHFPFTHNIIITLKWIQKQRNSPNFNLNRRYRQFQMQMLFNFPNQTSSKSEFYTSAQIYKASHAILFNCKHLELWDSVVHSSINWCECILLMGYPLGLGSSLLIAFKVQLYT